MWPKKLLQLDLAGVARSGQMTEMLQTGLKLHQQRFLHLIPSISAQYLNSKSVKTVAFKG